MPCVWRGLLGAAGGRRRVGILGVNVDSVPTLLVTQPQAPVQPVLCVPGGWPGS